jgi:hypothetical protein
MISKLKSLIKNILVSLFVALLTLGLIKIFNLLNFNQIKPIELARIVGEITAQQKLIETVWYHGDEARNYLTKINCLDNTMPAEVDYYRCNSQILKCLGDRIGLKLEQVSAKRIWSLTKKNINGIITSYEFPDPIGRVDFLLFDHCHQVELPKRVYKSSIGENFDWDNFYYTTLIDRFQVREIDFQQWKEAYRIEADDIELRRAYCAYRGGELLDVLHFEAASSYPQVLTKPELIPLNFYAYPWARKMKDPLEMEVNEDSCRMLFTEECEKKYSYNSWHTDNISWMGIYNVLGGDFELLDNKRASAVVKMSSRYFKRQSKYHKLGLYQDYNLFKEKYNNPVVFRCMWQL